MLSLCRVLNLLFTGLRISERLLGNLISTRESFLAAHIQKQQIPPTNRILTIVCQSNFSGSFCVVLEVFPVRSGFGLGLEVEGSL